MAEKGKNGNRDYKKEYAQYGGTAEQKKKRAMRNAAARNMKCPKGQSVEHIKPVRDGGTNAKSNLKCMKDNENKGWRKGKRGYD
jgi:hypothetical protein